MEVNSLRDRLSSGAFSSWTKHTHTHTHTHTHVYMYALESGCRSNCSRLFCTYHCGFSSGLFSALKDPALPCRRRRLLQSARWCFQGFAMNSRFSSHTHRHTHRHTQPPPHQLGVREREREGQRVRERIKASEWDGFSEMNSAGGYCFNLCPKRCAQGPPCLF